MTVLDWCDIDQEIWRAVRTHTDYIDPRREGLHLEVENLGLTSWARSVVHAMIDSGQVRELVCEVSSCLMPYRTFDTCNGRRTPGGLSLDHVQLRVDGGSHRPSNLRLAHYKCNCAWLTGRKRPAAVGKKIGDKVRGQKRTEEQKARLRASRALTSQNILVCDICGRECRGGTGLASHKRLAHPEA